jgi:hypothetical protein
MQQPEMLPVGSSQVIVVLANDPTEDTVICLAGEHDMSSVEQLSQAIAAAVDAGRSDLIFDLAVSSSWTARSSTSSPGPARASGRTAGWLACVTRRPRPVACWRSAVWLTWSSPEFARATTGEDPPSADLHPDHFGCMRTPPSTLMTSAFM